MCWRLQRVGEIRGCKRSAESTRRKDLSETLVLQLTKWGFEQLSGGSLIPELLFRWAIAAEASFP